jgi:hypothetical protein
MRVFVGSTTEAARPDGPLEQVCILLERAGHDPLPWKDAFPLGEHQFESLHNIVFQVEAAIFILTADDKTWYRGNATPSPRDNLIFEYGLFSGHLGNGSVIALVFGSDQPRLPSDLNGVTWGNLDRPNELAKRIRDWLSLVNEKTSEYIRHYPNKWVAPGGNKFWRDLSANATIKFGLVGRTNKSWISKSPAESRRFASSICDLILRGGNVFIVSLDLEQNRHVCFLRNLLIPHINSLGDCDRSSVRSRIASHLLYATYSEATRITYRAALSDNKLVLMPDMFDYEHRDNSLVLELIDGRHESFGYYIDDINRLVSRQSNGNHIISEIAEEIHE